MSTDDVDVDATEVMSNGHSPETSVVRRDAVEDGKYEPLVTDAAYLIRDGVLQLDDCTPDALLDDHEEPADEFVDTFHDDIIERADRLDASSKDRRREPRTQTTTNPEEIDWDELWSECGIEQGSALSGTQLALAIDVSSQTPITDEGATRLIDGAVDAGRLHHFPRKQRYVPTGGDGQ